MKKSVVLSLLFLLPLCIERAEAQSWVDALKGVVTEVVDEATGGQLTQMAIKGSWNYAGPGVKMGSDDTLSNLAGAAVESSIEAKLSSIYSKVGIRPGLCSITFSEGEEFSITTGSKTLTGSYEFDPSTHAITLIVGKLQTRINGYAYIDGTQLELLFPVDKLVSFATLLGSKISAFSSISKLLVQYDEVQLGFAFGK